MKKKAHVSAYVPVALARKLWAGGGESGPRAISERRGQESPSTFHRGKPTGAHKCRV